MTPEHKAEQRAICKDFVAMMVENLRKMSELKAACDARRDRDGSWLSVEAASGGYDIYKLRHGVVVDIHQAASFGAAMEYINT